MTFAVLGAGALGSILAALLHEAGEDVVLVARGPRALALKETGVRVTGLAELNAAVPVVEAAAAPAEPAALIVCVKTYDMEPALAALRHVRPGMALGLQNGVLKNDQLQDAFGPGAVLGCMADFSGELLPDGAALWTRNENLHIGELPDGASERVDGLVNVLRGAGIKAAASADIRSVEWSKFVAWLALTPVSVLSRLETHRFTQDPDLARLLVTIVKEAAAVAHAESIELEDLGGLLMARSLSAGSLDEGVALVQAFGRAMEAQGVTRHKMSALQDAERGRRLEVEETLGDAVRRAAARGLAVPALETCYRLLAALNRVSSPNSAR